MSDSSRESEKLLEHAEKAMQSAYCRYSGFRVGAALLCEDGSVYCGCNIENASFTPTVCAERVAFFKAVSDGKRTFRAIAVVGENTRSDIKGDITTPCGVCRQVMAEFCAGDFRIIMSDRNGKTICMTLDELLPLRFSL